MPHWPTDRWRRQNKADPQTPLVLTLNERNALRLHAIDGAASSLGLTPGMALADARALVPGLQVAKADPTGDQAALKRLAAWATRFSPWAAADGTDGLILDITGVAHLFGGEAAMLRQVSAAFAKLGLTVRLGIANSPRAAWAWAHFGAGGALPSPQALQALPVAALRLNPETTDRLGQLGLKKIGDVLRQPRGPLARRLGLALIERLDALQGAREEPISPLLPPAPWRARADFAEPIQTRAVIDASLEKLLDALCRLLEADGRGARRLLLHAYRADGSVQTLEAGTSQANRDPVHLFRLFRDRLETIEPGFGIDLLLLEAAATDPLRPQQSSAVLSGDPPRDPLPELLDRLQSRLGRGNVWRQLIQENHVPERAVRRAAPLSAWRDAEVTRLAERPILLLDPAELIEAEMGEEKPVRFRWRRVARDLAHCFGPERIREEWHREAVTVQARDYYRAEDTLGRRYWLYRRDDAWFLHGLFP